MVLVCIMLSFAVFPQEPDKIDIYNSEFFPSDKSTFRKLKYKEKDIIYCKLEQKHITSLPGSAIVDSYILYTHDCPKSYPHSKFVLPNESLMNVYDTHWLSFDLQMNYVLYHLRDVYFQEYAMIMIDDTVYYMDRWSWRVKEFNYPLNKAWDNALYVSGSFGTGYGDFILGCLVRMLHFPRRLFPGSVILIYSYTIENCAKEILDIMDIDGYQLVGGPWYNWDYAHNLYCLLPDYRKDETHDVHHSYYGPMTSNYARFVRQAYHLDEIEPVDYVIFNRGKDRARGMTNEEEVFETLRAEYPSINFTKIKVYRFFKDTSKVYARIKWILSGCGSNMMNCFFMKPGTGVLIYIGEWYDYPAVNCPTCAGCVVLAYRRNYNHYSPPAATLNMDDIRKYTKMHFEMMEMASHSAAPLPDFAEHYAERDNSTISYFEP